MSSNQFVNSILQIKPFVTGEFVKLHINFIGFIERYAQPDTIFTISQLIYTRILFIIRTITFRRNEMDNHMDNNPNGNRPDNNKGPGRQDPNKNHQSILAFLVCLLVTLVCFAMFTNMLKDNSSEITYDKFIEMVDDGDVKEVTLQSNTLTITPKHQSSGFSEEVYYANQMESVDKLTERLEGTGIKFEYKKPDAAGEIISMLVSVLLPTILLFVLLTVFMRRMNKGGGMMGVGKSRAKAYIQKDTGITFRDVAGQDEAKESLQEVVDFLHNPGKYTTIGAKLPKGALLVGPPGTGKTLLAKAVAGEAHVPFFSLSGSEFVEMFVGVGASRVRDLFEEAKKNAPCIIFIDEIDAIGKSRDSHYGGGNDEREQTLNQLLAEMDGFDTSKGLLILAATNRPEVLDPALLRPGRFDRRIIVDKPDLKGRLETLKVHSKDVKMDESVDLDALALATAGLVGSDLANMINEAAINAVKNGRQLVNQSDLFEAFELVAVGGKEKKDRVMSDKERKIVSYHEVGHALVSALQKNTEPVQKITIVPRTMGALGYTLQTPEEEKYLETKDELLAKITTYMAGRAAEVLVFNSVTSGAANDIENATKIARAMVTMYGMSDKFGMMCLATVQNQYLEGGAGLICGENTASQIDDEVLSIINSSYAEAMKLLDENREILDSISDYLYQKETITGKEFMKMFRDMKGLPDPDEEKDGEESKEQENAQNDAQKDTTSAADPLLRNATDQPADTNESSEYTAPDDNTLNN